jgi:hypothetical protein
MDSIEKLQTDDSDISDKDQYIINTIFCNTESEVVVKTSYHLKQVFIITILFSLLSLPIIDEKLETLLKIKNIYIKLLIKTIVFLISYFLLINYVVKN